MIEKKKRKNVIQGEINQYNHDKGRISSMLKKHKLFSLVLIVTEIYRFKIVHFLLICGL